LLSSTKPTETKSIGFFARSEIGERNNRGIRKLYNRAIKNFTKTAYTIGQRLFHDKIHPLELFPVSSAFGDTNNTL
jgi:hypothetical protein